MSFTRQRSDRPDPARRRQVHTPELLESRQLLSGTLPSYLAPYTPSDLYVTNPITNQRIPTSIRSLVQHNNPNSPLLSNQGKIVSGTDRQGDQWTITVHGPGQVIVTDTTPNDGSLDDEINTIQIIGSNPRTTYVTGTAVASNTVLSSGTVNFNRLIALNGVKSIALNGFNLSHDVTPAVAQQAGIFLYGGVGTLRFNDILALIDTTGTNVTNPYEIVIGDPSTPLTVKPSIYLDSIYNSVFDGTVAPTTANAAPVGPLTTPSVIFSINGVVQNFSVVSVTQSAAPPNYVIGSQGGTVAGWTDTPGVPNSGPVPAGFQFFYNVVGTTGRTSLQAQAINHLNVKGKSTNLTAQRDLTPFTSSLSGLKYLRNARFGGNADGVALDVNGPIGKVEFQAWAGRPERHVHRHQRHSQPEHELAPEVPVDSGDQLRRSPGFNGLSRRGTLGGRGGRQVHRQGQGGTGQLHHSDLAEPELRAGPAAAVPDLLHGESRHSGHELGDHDQRLDRLGDRHGKPAQQRDQDRLRLRVVYRRTGRNAWRQPDRPAPPAGRPRQQRDLGELPTRQEFSRQFRLQLYHGNSGRWLDYGHHHGCHLARNLRWEKRSRPLPRRSVQHQRPDCIGELRSGLLRSHRSKNLPPPRA